MSDDSWFFVVYVAGAFLFALFGLIALLGLVAGWPDGLVLRATAVSVISALVPLSLLGYFLLEDCISRILRRMP